jgi:hypothetical protein
VFNDRGLHDHSFSVTINRDSGAPVSVHFLGRPIRAILNDQLNIATAFTRAVSIVDDSLSLDSNTPSQNFTILTKIRHLNEVFTFCRH